MFEYFDYFTDQLNKLYTGYTDTEEQENDSENLNLIIKDESIDNKDESIDNKDESIDNKYNKNYDQRNADDKQGLKYESTYYGGPGDLIAQINENACRNGYWRAC